MYLLGRILLLDRDLQQVAKLLWPVTCTGGECHELLSRRDLLICIYILEFVVCVLAISLVTSVLLVEI